MTDTLAPALDAETLALFTASIARYGQDNYDFGQYRKLQRTAPGFSVQAWKDYAAMGWLAAAMPLDDGGFDSHPAAVAALMRYAGEHLALEPLFANVVLCARMLALCGGTGAARERLQALASGSRLFAFAHAENPGDAMDDEVAVRFGDGTLSGDKLAVLHGDVAEELLVTALEPDAGRAGARLALFAVNVAQPGVDKTSYKLVDGRGAASFIFQRAVATPLVAQGADSAMPGTALAPQGNAGAILERTLDDARMALCAEAHGAMRALNRLTLAYLKDRRQFGRPIGTNQALQHRMVELFMLEQEVAAVIGAAQRSANHAPAVRQRAIMGAVTHTMTAGRQISHEAVQMHGGIGTTDELAIGHYFKRIMVINRLLGDRDAHLDKFAAADVAMRQTAR